MDAFLRCKYVLKIAVTRQFVNRAVSHLKLDTMYLALARFLAWILL